MLEGHQNTLKAIESLREIAEQRPEALRKSLLEVLNSDFAESRRSRQVAEFVVEQIREHLQDIEKQRGGDIVQPTNRTYIKKMSIVGRTLDIVTSAKVSKLDNRTTVSAKIFDDSIDYMAEFSGLTEEEKADRADKFQLATEAVVKGKNSDGGPKGLKRIIIATE